MKRLFFTVLIVFIALAGGLFAQTANDPNEGCQMSHHADGTYTFSWWGRAGRTYFIQSSTNMLPPWSYLPVIESGSNQLIQYGFTSSASRFFLRLRYADIPTTDPLNADFDGDGVSNWNELLGGKDPLDFYNGVLPTLSIVGGGDQRGVPGMLSVPLSVAVNNGANNAPVSFTVASGGALISTIANNPAPTSTVQTRATTVNESQQYVAQIYVYLPNTPGDLSVITASAVSGTESIAITTTAVSVDQALPAPTGVAVIVSSDSTASLTWTPSSSDQPTTVQASVDGGATWTTLGVVAPGVGGATVTDLTPKHLANFRLITGGVYTSGGNVLSMLTGTTAGVGTGGATGTGGIIPGADVPPVQNYAAIDVSGGGSIAGNIQRIALDDNGNGAFAFGDDLPTSIAWVNAKVSAPNTVVFPADGRSWSLSQDDGHDMHSGPWYFVAPNGTIYGSADVDGWATINTNGNIDYVEVWTTFGFQCSKASGFVPADDGNNGFTFPPTISYYGEGVPWSYVTGCAGNGYCGQYGISD